MFLIWTLMLPHDWSQAMHSCWKLHRWCRRILPRTSHLEAQMSSTPHWCFNFYHLVYVTWFLHCIFFLTCNLWGDTWRQGQCPAPYQNWHPLRTLPDPIFTMSTPGLHPSSRIPSTCISPRASHCKEGLPYSLCLFIHRFSVWMHTPYFSQWFFNTLLSIITFLFNLFQVGPVGDPF